MKDVISVPCTPLCLTHPTPAEYIILPACRWAGVSSTE